MFGLAVVVGLLKGRVAVAALAVATWAALTLVAQLTIDTVLAAEAPWGDAWLVVILQLVSWVPALLAAAGPAREGSWWERAGRPTGPTPIRAVVANFVWVFAITLLGILFDGVDILGGEIFCAVFAALLAAVMLFGVGAARTQTA